VKQELQLAGFKKYGDTVDGAMVEISSINSSSLCSFGIGFLDSQLIKIHPQSLIVITADSGIGKTSFVSDIAIHNEESGRRVACIFLEGDKQGFQKETVWQEIIRLMKEDNKSIPPHYNFTRFRNNMITDIKDIQDKAVLNNKKKYGNLQLFDRDEFEEINSSTISSILTSISEHVDLIVIDHLHYFDNTFSETQNKEITLIMKQIKKFTDISKTPVVLVSHVKKPYGNKLIILDMYDLKGSSAIYQEADECIMLAQYTNSQSFDPLSNNSPTLFRVAKSRCGVSKMLIGMHNYLKDDRKYSEEFEEFYLRENWYDADQKKYYPQKLLPTRRNG